jgi:hypothetical protein
VLNFSSGTGDILIKRYPEKELLSILMTTSAKKPITEQIKRKQELDFNEMLNVVLI